MLSRLRKTASLFENPRLFTNVWDRRGAHRARPSLGDIRDLLPRTLRKTGEMGAAREKHWSFSGGVRRD